MGQHSRQISVSSFDDSEREALLNEVRSLHVRLERLFDTASDVGPIPTGCFERADTERQVRNIIRLRRRRERFFGSDLFGEPAWDMLLELYAAELAGRRECVSGLCCVSGVPTTTALRWISLLEDSGWIARKADVLDRRRSFLSLTAKARTAMDGFFAQPELAQVL